MTYKWRASAPQASTLPDVSALQPCGTESAYTRHRRRGEPMDDACREAHAAAERERWLARRSQTVTSEPAAPPITADLTA